MPVAYHQHSSPPGIDALVRETGLYRYVIAERAGIHKNYIGDIIAGRRHMTPSIANRLAPVLGVTPEYLLGTEARE